MLDGKIEGEFTQSGVNGTFWLGRPGDDTALPEPAGHESMFRSEQVTFSNGGIVLAGELTLPDGDGPHPGVVLISGSGDQDRDSSLFGFRVFAVLAEHLAELGIASLRFDDRGVGGSTGDGLTTTIQDRADDVEAAVGVLGSRDDVDVDRIGLIGHSEGGLVAPIVANRSESVAFVVLLASSAVPGDDLLRTQQRTLLQLAGAADDEIERAQAFQQLTLDAISAGQGWDEVEASYRALARQEVQALPEQEREAISDVDTYIDAIVRASLVSWRSPRFKSFVEYDPRPAIAALRVPVFALFGELDSQVAPGINATATSEAIAESNTAGFAIATVAMSNHLFQVATTGSVDEYALLKPEFAPEFVDFLTDWLTAQVGGR